MQSRQYHMYTPQSNSPASAVSSQGPEQPNRIYSQPPQMYYAPYGVGQMPSNTYSQHPSQSAQVPHQMMTPPHSAIPHQNQPPMSHQQANAHVQPIASSPRSQPKFDTSIPRPLDTNNLQNTPAGHVSASHNTPTSSSQNGNGAQTNQPGSAAGNPSAAPGPIPATTPLVVRQDNNGVQWIAFEYSRDRVKMEYTIRCDVESVNVDSLSKEFKEANCVYPRAFCEKGKYTGNRLNYETECNTVGWSLVELNPSLKEKRGLIQRAVDSWRNSNQDSRLRSRRVRRMNKQTTRSKNQNSSHMAGPRDVSTPPNVSTAMLQQRSLPPNMNPASAAQLQHQHTNADGSISTGTESMIPNGHYDHHHLASKMHPSEGSSQIRPANVFQGYPNYPLQPNTSAVSIAPPLQNGMESHMSSHPATSIPASSTMKIEVPPSHSARSGSSSPITSSKDLSAFYPNLPGKKFINVTDPGHNPNRVRVKLDLRDTPMEEIVDDYRERNSVLPRSYFPHQMRLTSEEKRQQRREGRFHENDEEIGDGFGVGRTMVKLPTMEGETEAPVPRLRRRIGEEEETLNDLGYRISWDQVQRYDRRVTFLQRSRK